MDIAILGATGVYARHLLPRLAAAGHDLRALVRDPARAGIARACGARVLIADIFDEASLAAALAGADICLNLATALPGPSGRGASPLNDRLRREGVPVLTRAMARAGVPRLLQQSIAMIATGPAPTDGTGSPVPKGEGVIPDALRAALAMEDTVRAAPLDTMILRGGLFYGPGTGSDELWTAQAAAGKLLLPSDPEAWLSQIHVSDMAAATVRALTRWHGGATIAVADDRPLTWRELFTTVSELAGTPPPGPGSRPTFDSFRIDNARARDLLDWAPHYPDCRAGLAR